MHVVIGIDPHKLSHTAVAIGEDEHELASLKVRASSRQVDQLLKWARRSTSGAGLSSRRLGWATCSASN